MKKVYWRPSKISQGVLILIAFFSLSCLILVERMKTKVEQPYYEEAIAAATLTQKAFSVVKFAAKKKGIQIDPEFDPTQSALIGKLMTPITSNTGHLDSKQTTINPNFAAIIVNMLKKAQLNKDDHVAVGVSGSFPALNIAVYAALKTLDIKPIIISSASASQWGANNVNFSWLDMEKLLVDKGIFNFQSIAASIGGIEDRGLGMSKKGKEILKKLIENKELYFINVKDFTLNVDERMSVYQQGAGTHKIKAYINVGGGTVSVGRYAGKTLYKAGLNKTLPFGGSQIDSIMTRFSRKGLPVLHLIKVNNLAEKYGLPISPTEMVKVGSGQIYYLMEYNDVLAILALLAILLCLYAFIRSDLGYRIFQSSRKGQAAADKPKQMV